jgi:hypothetical protein
MSNFNCEKCGVSIIEGRDGHYVTGCPHYPTKDQLTAAHVPSIDWLDRKAHLVEIIKECKWFCAMGRSCDNQEIIDKFRLRRRVMEHRLKAI